VSQLEDKSGRFTQVGGLKYTFDPAAEAGKRVSEVLVMKDGAWAPIDPETVYGVVTNNFVRQGGDGFRMFGSEGMNAYDYGPDLADVVAEYMAKAGTYTPALDGRITRK
jgi:5'-nucleotidase